MFQVIPSAARDLNAKLVKMFEAGLDEGPDAYGCSEILDVTRQVQGSGGKSIFMHVSTRRGLARRVKGTNTETYQSPKVHTASVETSEPLGRIQVPLLDWKHDTIGEFESEAYEAGVQAATSPIINLEELAETGDAAGATAYGDGVPFFSTSHPVDKDVVGSPTWANKLVQAGGLTIDNYGAGIEAFIKFPSVTSGKAFGARPTHLLVSPSYLGIGTDLTESRLPSTLSGAENKWLNYGIKLIVVPNWQTRDMWMLCDARSSMDRAFIYVEEQKIRLMPVAINPDDPMVISRGYLEWMVYGEDAVQYGRPHRALLSVKS